MKGLISSHLDRGVMTYKCSCGGKRLRIYKVEDKDEKTYTHLVCLDCLATALKEWEELLPLSEIILGRNGDVDEKCIDDMEGR